MKKMMVALGVGVFMAPMMAQIDAGRADSGNHHAPAWIVALSGIEQMEHQKGGPEVVKKLLADPRTIIVAGNPLPSTMRDNESQRAVSVLSLDKCKAALDKPSNAGLKTLLVDLERWPGTPLADQRNPEGATRECHELAHQDGRHISVIAVPAMDLMSVLDPKFKGTQYQAAIHYDLEGKLATASDGVDVQLENIEDKPGQFEQTLRTFVHQIKEARRKANLSPEVPIYVGLSTAVVNKRIPTDILASMLREDVTRTRGLVTGYWMAIPSKNLCPGCGEPNPEVAIRLLQSLDE
ncbi:MAG TPA: hypothetical protein VKY65_19385 [Alphaproteobacteria bacterium]|nr:hypothetical protein [Alphaproteobacteria bacterium]